MAQSYLPVRNSDPLMQLRRSENSLGIRCRFRRRWDATTERRGERLRMRLVGVLAGVAALYQQATAQENGGRAFSPDTVRTDCMLAPFV